MQLQREVDYVWVHQQGHDAFLISVPEGREEECSNLIMQIGGGISVNIKGRLLIIPWEMTMGYSWGAMYESYGRMSYADWQGRVKDDERKGKLAAKGIIKAAYGVL
jgi:hypothetical protein